MRRVLGVIPARLKSTRLPFKMIRKVAGVPLVVRVYQAVSRCTSLDEVLVATDSEQIAAVCRQHGVPFLLTSPDHPSGTDRVWEVARSKPADIYVNIQGDEPLVTPEHISALVAPLLEAPDLMVSTLCYPVDIEDARSPDVVKVVRDARGCAIYFSRALIPFPRDGETTRYLKHLGFYAYRRDALELFHRLPVGRLEQIEKLEQLRLLENGIRIYVADAPADTLGVDTEDDLHRAEEIVLRERYSEGKAA